MFAVTEFSLKDSSPCLSSASDVVQGNINFAHTCPGMLTILLFKIKNVSLDVNCKLPLPANALVPV